jgi:hypothetical protein
LVSEMQRRHTSTASMWCLNLRALMRNQILAAETRGRGQLDTAAVSGDCVILEHQSSNSTPNTSRAMIKLYQRSMGNHSNVLERGRLFCSGYTQGRWLLKCLGVSPFTLAKTIELQAWRGIEPWLTPKILRAVVSEAILLPIINSS